MIKKIFAGTSWSLFSGRIAQRMAMTLRSRGIRVTRSTDIEILRESFMRLRPIKTDIPLIRLGADGDGGYLVPDDLRDIGQIFSPGVYDNWTFETAISELTGASVHMIECGDVPQGCPFPVQKGYLGGFSTDDEVGINDWLWDHAGVTSQDYLLQMDIEGSEYGTILGLSDELLKRFRIIVLELHDLHLMDVAAWHDNIFLPTVKKLLRYFTVVHVHANNAGRLIDFGSVKVPQVLEITLLRKDRISRTDGFAPLPNPLDYKNRPEDPDIELEAFS